LELVELKHRTYELPASVDQSEASNACMGDRHVSGH
jgi:hypothetical protein